MAKFEYVEFLEILLDFKEHEFEWDRGNVSKSNLKHNVQTSEAEEAFYDGDLLVLGIQISPLMHESRYGIIGKTVAGRLLYISFTFRNGRIRIISSRTANKCEKGVYEK